MPKFAKPVHVVRKILSESERIQKAGRRMHLLKKAIPLWLVLLVVASASAVVAAALYNALTATITTTGPLATVATKPLSLSVNAGDSASQAPYVGFLNITNVASTGSKIKVRIYLLNPTGLRGVFDSFAVNATAFKDNTYTTRAGGVDTGMMDILGVTYTYLYLTGSSNYYIEFYLTYTVKPTASSGTVNVPIFVDVVPET
jgi:hypothetical protein